MRKILISRSARKRSPRSSRRAISVRASCGASSFALDMPKRDLHPFRRVPTLVHDDFVLYETQAITRYIDEAFAGPAFQPVQPRQRARMAQVISIIDAYGYVPMVRQ